MKILFFYLPLILSSLVNAKELALVSGEYSRFQTSDDLVQIKKSLRIINNRRNLFWNYSETQSTAFDIGAEITLYSGEFGQEVYSSTSGLLLLGRKWNPDNYSQISLGGHSLESTEDSFSTIIFDFSHLHQFDSSRGSFSVSKNFQFLSQQIPAPLTEGHYVEKLAIYWEYTGIESWRFPTNMSYSSISDGNKTTEYDMAMYYGRAYPTWWWFGYGVSGLAHDIQTAGYWSPKRFFAHGPRAEVSYNISNLWQVSAGLNYNIIREDNFDPGTSTYSSLGIQYGERDKGIISLNWIELKSEQESNLWSSKGHTFLFEKSF